MLLTGAAAAAARAGALPLVGKRVSAAAAAAAAASYGAARAAGATHPLLLPLRALSTALPKQQRKGGMTLPTRNPQRISAATLQGKPPAAILDALKQKCEGDSRPRLSDLHALLEAARADAGQSQGVGAVLGEGLALFARKNVEFREETASLFVRAMCRAGGLAEAVDALLDKGTRLGIWAPRKAIHMALHKLGQEKDAERLVRLYEAMPKQLGVPHTARSVHLAVRGLVNAGAAEQAQALAAAAEKTMALADSTKEILSQAKAAPAAAEETKEKGKEGEEGQAAAGAEEGAKK